MRTRSLASLFGIAVLLAASGPALARTVNCELVKKDLKMGQWPEDIALQQGITLTDVKNCQNAAPAKPASQQKSGATKKPAAHDAKGT